MYYGPMPLLTLTPGNKTTLFSLTIISFPLSSLLYDLLSDLIFCSVFPVLSSLTILFLLFSLTSDVLFETAEPAIISSLDQFTAPALAKIVWCYATAGVDAPLVFEAAQKVHNLHNLNSL